MLSVALLSVVAPLIFPEFLRKNEEQNIDNNISVFANFKKSFRLILFFQVYDCMTRLPSFNSYLLHFQLLGPIFKKDLIKFCEKEECSTIWEIF
jgi:hypothetical protein